MSGKAQIMVHTINYTAVQSKAEDPPSIHFAHQLEGRLCGLGTI